MVLIAEFYCILHFMKTLIILAFRLFIWRNLVWPSASYSHFGEETHSKSIVSSPGKKYFLSYRSLILLSKLLKIATDMLYTCTSLFPTRPKNIIVSSNICWRWRANIEERFWKAAKKNECPGCDPPPSQDTGNDQTQTNNIDDLNNYASIYSVPMTKLVDGVRQNALVSFATIKKLFTWEV